MRIGIIELMNSHYTLVDTLVQIFANDKNNQVEIFINQQLKEKIQYLEKRENVTISCRQRNESITDFIQRINTYNPDIQFITTLESKLSAFLKLSHPDRSYLFIHNINNWTKKGWFTFLKEAFQLNPLQIRSFLILLKRAFLFPLYRKKILTRILNSGGRLIVLTEKLKEQLSEFYPPRKIHVIPYRVHDPEITDLSARNKKLRVCIPGLMNTRKRDYHSLIRMIQDNQEFYRKHVIFDLLGRFVNMERKQEKEIIYWIKELNEKGVEILYYQQYINSGLYDKHLAMADILLGNLYVHLKDETYGITKETGVIFNMIYAGKPALLPADYQVDSSLEKGIIHYDNYKELDQVIMELRKTNVILNTLKTEAKTAAKAYTPEKIRNILQMSPA
ncbi:MAG: hypothetical protein ACOCW8_01430 [bacterium]